MPSTFAYHAFAFARSFTWYAAVLNPLNMACSLPEPSVDPAAETGGRPAANAARHSNAKSIVRVERVLSFKPRTGFVSATAAGARNPGRVAAFRLRMFPPRALLARDLRGDFIFGISALRSPLRAVAAANATIAPPVSGDAIRARICVAGVQPSPKFPCDSFPAH